jgi:hypothetical protein
MLLGTNAADQLTTATAPFSDVPASKWSAGAIAYCAEREILAGTGDGTFKPEDTLTGYAFAKMLLIALGYDPTAQGYTGSGWALNVAGDAVDAGIDISGLVMSNNLTREQAAEMAYKTLEADIVDYDSRGVNVTTTDGTSVNVGASKPEAKSVSPSISNYNNAVAGDSDYTTLQFVEKYFPKLKKNESATDSFNRPGVQWTNNATNEKLPIALETPVQTYTAGTKAATVASDLSAYKLVYTDGAGNKTTKNITNTDLSSNFTFYSVYKNGADAQAETIASGSSVASYISGLTNDGKLVEVYANSNNEVTDIVAVDYTVGEVTSVTTTSTQTNYVINGQTYRDYVDANASDTISIASGATIAKGDIVTYIEISGKAYVYPTTQVTGAQTSKDTGNNQITVGGTVYPVGVGVYTNHAQTNQVSMTSFDNSSAEAIYYLDQFGYVVKTTSIASNDYAYVLDTYGSYSDGLGGGTPSITARVVLSDGTVVDRAVALSKASNGTWSVKNTSVTIGTSTTISAGGGSSYVDTQAAALEGNAYTYTLTDSQITLKSVTGWAGNTDTNTVYTLKPTTNTQIVKNQNSYSIDGKTVLVDNSTKFVIYSGNPNTAVVYTGSANLPSTISGSNNYGYFVVKSEDVDTGTTNRGTASVVFINRGANDALTATNSSNYAYVSTTKFVQTLVDGTTNYVYTATKADGSTIELTSTTQIDYNGIYTYSDSNVLNTTALADTTATNTRTDSDRIIYDTNVSVSGSLVEINVDPTDATVTGFYSITSDTQIVYIDDNLGEVNNNGGFFVFEVSDGQPTENLAAIFITID